MYRKLPIRRGAPWRAGIAIGASLALALSACASAPAADNAAAGTAAASDGASMASAASSESAPAASGESSSGDASSSDASSQATSSEASGETDASPANNNPTRAPIDNEVTITTPGMQYDISGPLRPGVGSITLNNTDGVAHMMAIAHLKDGVDFEQVTAALAKSEDALSPLLAEPIDTTFGSPDVIGAGQSETVTGIDWKPGNYLLACFLTDNNGMSHAQMGMIGQLVVAGDPASEKPESDGTIAVDDSGITLPGGFNGIGTFLVTNSGASPHNISIARLEDGTPLAQFAGYVGMSMGSGKAIDGGGGLLVGGIDALAPGQSAYLTLNLAPGHYGYISSADMAGPELPKQSGEFDVS